MKSKLLLTVILISITGILIYGFVSLNGNDPYGDYAPNSSDKIIQQSNNSLDTITPGNWPYPVKWNFNFSGISGVNGGTVGATKFSGFYYLNRWNSTICYKYDDSGVNGGPGIQTPITYTGSIRDMTVANGHIWGGKASSSLYKFDANMNTVNIFPISGAQIRAIAWDPNRGGFWVANWTTPLTCYDSTGTVLATINIAVGGKYGLAWDSTSGSPAVLWLWSQALPNNELRKINAQTGNVMQIYIFPSGGMISGGAEVVKIGPEVNLLLNFQNNALVCYTLRSGVPIFFDQFPNLVNWMITNNGGTCVWQNFFPPYPNAYTLPPESSGGVLAADADDCGSGTTLLSTATIASSINCTGYDNIYLEWDNDWQHHTAQDIARVQASYNGGVTWGTVVEWSGVSKRNSHESYPLPGAANNNNLLIRFVSIQPGWDWWWVIDNVHVSGDIMTNITTYGNEIPEGYSLSQNYPNPFNPVTNINYSIPEAGLVNLKVYDVLGKEVAALVNEYQNPGQYSVEFNGSDFASGTYFYRIQSGGFTQVKRMVMLK